ncbi:MAG: hypothetical protein JXB34_02135 [Bacteroidales bacterium]|nr:hypothetical protein [Bacteroidales bacterium]
MTNKRYKYCRYKGYKLSVDNDFEDLIQTSTTELYIGEYLGMTRRDRDWFVMDILKTKIDAIWTISSEAYTYDTIEVEFGKIIVNDCEIKYDKYFNDLIMKGEFASYRGVLYKSISGVNHNYYFKLISLDIDSQENGFIMEDPGRFYKQVNPKQIDFAFQSMTWCKYMNRDFVVVESPMGTTIKIQPWSRESYSENELIEMGFENLSKWIDASEAESIWTKTEKVFDFDRFENKDKKLK